MDMRSRNEYLKVMSKSDIKARIRKEKKKPWVSIVVIRVG